MDWDRFEAYSSALDEVLSAESGRSRPPADNQQTIRQQARDAFDAVFEKQRAREN